MPAFTTIGFHFAEKLHQLHKISVIAGFGERPNCFVLGT